MKLVPYDVDKIEGYAFYAKSNNYKILQEFIDSGLDCVEVTEYNHTNHTSCQSSLWKSIRTYRMNSIRCFSRKGKVFLIKAELVNGKYKKGAR